MTAREDGGEIGPVWRCGSGWVVRVPSPPDAGVGIKLIAGLRPERDAPGSFVLVSGEAVMRRFEARGWSVDDEFGTTAYVVEGDALQELRVFSRPGHRAELTLSKLLDEVILAKPGLEVESALRRALRREGPPDAGGGDPG